MFIEIKVNDKWHRIQDLNFEYNNFYLYEHDKINNSIIVNLKEIDDIRVIK
jgi:hypothetical protein